jgi:hypothetical protein
MLYKMDGLSLLLYSLLLCALVSCDGAKKSNETIKAAEKTDCCKLDSNNTYEVYIPERNSIIGKLPLLIIIDAHGRGKFALDKFKQGANQYPAILAASNLIKNGFVNYQGAIQTLIEDVRQKYPAGEVLFMTGFSGGARMTLGYAMSHQVDGLILCGALANADQINSIHCPVISISGMDDFNFMETAQYLFQEQSIQENLKIELINASHDWPDSLILTNAFGFLQLSCQSADIPSLTKSQLGIYCENQHVRIDTLKKHGDFLKAALVARNMSFTAPFNGDDTFASSYKNLKYKSEYFSQLDRLKKCLTFEINVRKPYINAFMKKDIEWWKNEVKTLDEKIKTEQDSYKNDMYRRIKAFLGIECYSLSNRTAKEHNAKMLNKIVSIYRMLEPDNPDMFYFSAFLYFWEENNGATLSLLKKARKAGFSDINRLKKDFPESITSKISL